MARARASHLVDLSWVGEINLAARLGWGARSDSTLRTVVWVGHPFDHGLWAWGRCLSEPEFDATVVAVACLVGVVLAAVQAERHRLPFIAGCRLVAPIKSVASAALPGEAVKSRPENLGDMDPEELRRWGHQAVDWVADYLSDVGDYPVVAPVAPGQIRSRLPAAPPARGEPMPRILEDLDTIVLPGLTHWNHPRFFAYFAITGSGPGIIGELVTAALNVNGMLWRTSPVATELEQVTLDWLRQLLGLPDGFAGVIMDTASMSTLVALASAREQAGLDVRVKGFPGRGEVPRLRIYASEEAHSSVEKAAITLGLGQQGVRKIATDDVYRMDPHALATAVVQDRAQGWQDRKSVV